MEYQLMKNLNYFYNRFDEFIEMQLRPRIA